MTVKITLLGVALFRKEDDERPGKPKGNKLVIRFPGSPDREKHYDCHPVTHHHPWLYAKPHGSGHPLRIPLAGCHVSIEGTGGTSPDDAFPNLIPMEKVMANPQMIPVASIPSVDGPCRTMINLYDGQLQGGNNLSLTFQESLKDPDNSTDVNGVWRTSWESFAPGVVARIWTDANPNPTHIPLKDSDWAEIYLVNADEPTPEKSVEIVGCKKGQERVVDNDFRWIYHLLYPGIPGPAEQAWKERLMKAGLGSLPCPVYQCPSASTGIRNTLFNPEVGTCLQASLDG